MAVKYKLVAIPDEPNESASNVYTTPGCIYNPVGVRCDPEDRRCEKCGHNPAVAEARLKTLYPWYKPPKVSAAPAGDHEPDGNG